MHARTWAAAVALAHQFLLRSALVGAQWIKQPTVGIPRAADGKAPSDCPGPADARGDVGPVGLWILDGSEWPPTSRTPNCPCGEGPVPVPGVKQGPLTTG
jgi:hypothetical protein